MKTMAITLVLLAIIAAPAFAQQEDDEAIDESQYLETVEIAPSIVGGLEALSKNVVYPDTAVKTGVQGMVIVRVLISATGRIDKASIERSDSPLLSQAALDAVRGVRFLPGKAGDQPVKCKVMVPVKFRLK
ncbi:MAG: energy transducer TonB [Bacteroidetes bacterium]|nr:energy transducer TonB [Bacteroidota bacterium]